MTLNDTGTNPQLGCVFYIVINDKNIFTNNTDFSANYVLNPNPIADEDLTNEVSDARTSEHILIGESLSVMAGSYNAVKGKNRAITVKA